MPEKHPIHAKYPELHKAPVVEKAATRHRSSGESIPNEPPPKLEAWLSDLGRIHDPNRPEVLQRIKRIYHRDYITGTDDASVERYLRHQAQIAQDQGHGMAEELMQRATEAVREEARTTIREDQERSLDTWLDYLSSEDATYPMWFKYYVFRNITKLAEFDKQKGEFPKRSKSTTAPFPDINREALAYMEDSLAKHYGLKPLDPNSPEEQLDPQMKELLDKDANFAGLYRRAIDYAAPKTIENLDVTDGVWVKYDQTDDAEEAKKLAHSLHGYGTGWCTAGEGTAQSQLAGGDFYVYYTKSEDGQYSVPRVAIRMEEGNIAEVRGIEANQNIEGALVPIAELKMNEVDPQGAEGYKKKAEDMRRLTDVYDRHQAGGELSIEDLRFLYQIDLRIEGFGYEQDPRIDNIVGGRDERADLSLVLGVAPDKISFDKKEALSGGIIFHYGDLYLDSLTFAEGLTLPQSVGGNLDLSGLTSAEGLTLPESIGGDLYLDSLTSAEGLTLPQNIVGNLNLYSLTSAEGLTLPESVGGNLDLSGLTSPEGLNLPQNIDGHLDLSGLTSAEGLSLPQSIGGGLYLESLTSAEGLSLPQNIGGDLDLDSLTSAEGLTLPQSIGGNIYLRSLTSAEGLTLPQSIGGNIYLRSLTSSDKQKLRDQRPDLVDKIR